VTEIELDGSEGEGGGQILRTALSLAAITGQPFRLTRIRANRSKPGLRRQHLACVLAAAELARADTEGAEVGSRELRFRPARPVGAGNYRFAIGTAGSSTLLLQTVLWPLLLAGGPSVVVVEGGTHNPHAPPFEFLARTFAPAIRRTGAELALTLERCGFYPKGGGRIRAAISGGSTLRPLELSERGASRARRGLILLCRLPDHIATREAAALAEALEIDRRDIAIETPASPGPGNAVHAILEHDEVTEVATGFGERGVPAERVAAHAATAALAYIDSDAPVGEHLADQLVIPLALAGGAVRCTQPSLHTLTNLSVAGRFLPTRVEAIEEPGGRWWLRASPHFLPNAVAKGH
jgi:RNA 3'-terminal phosphate cyclase (ATP)